MRNLNIQPQTNEDFGMIKRWRRNIIKSWMKLRVRQKRLIEIQRQIGLEICLGRRHRVLLRIFDYEVQRIG